MKTIAQHYRFTLFKTVLVLFLTFSGQLLMAQSSGYTVPQAIPNLLFRNGILESGSDGADLATYRFPSVLPGTDARVTILRRSSTLVRVKQIDQNSIGYADAFQPEISYNGGSTGSPASWWVEFSIQFVQSFTTNASPIKEFYASCLDMDGDNSRLYEKLVFYGTSSYKAAVNSALVISSSTDSVNGSLQTGRVISGTTMDFPGVDSSSTSIMASVRYLNRDKITFRLGGTSTGASTQTSRIYSVYFKPFQYNSPSFLLPLMLYSFDAGFERNNISLNWTTSWEKNLNHFEMERSTDGKHFMPFAYVAGTGYASDKTNYRFTESLPSGEPRVLYFRLKLVTNDGNYGYSAVRIVRVSEISGQFSHMQVYPNPAVSDMHVAIPAGWQGQPVVYEVYNLTGIRVKYLNNPTASQVETIDISDLTRGQYIVRIRSAQGDFNQKLIRQ